ncbi:hypothetical protein MMC19_005125 [Ptychographa xylographoides]|nr:hypothetical protein [Ptychographa xylographoides]
MSTLASKVGWGFPRNITLQSCRKIAGRRFLPVTRAFRTTSNLAAPDDDPTSIAEQAWNPIRDFTVSAQDDSNPSESEDIVDDAEPSTTRKQEATDTNTFSGTTLEIPVKPKDKSAYGSAVRRAGRNIKRPKESPRFTLPAWFLDRNVKLHEEVSGSTGTRLIACHGLESSSSSPLRLQPLLPELEPALATNPVPTNRALMPDSTSTQSFGKDVQSDSQVYEIDSNILTEISAMVTAGLRPSSGRFADGYAASKPHILLQSPKNGGTFFLDAVVNHVALKHRADVISIDAQDIAEIAAEYAGELPDMPSNSVRSLGYDTYLMMPRHDNQSTEEIAAEDEEYDDGDEDVDHNPRSRQPTFQSQSKAHIMPVVTFLGSAKLSEFLGAGRMLGSSGTSESSHQTSNSVENQSSFSHAAGDSAKTFVLLESFLDAAQIKRKEKLILNLSHATKLEGEESETVSTPSYISENPESNPSTPTPKPPPLDLIIAIKDYAELNATRTGGVVLNKLHEVIQKRRIDGQRVLVIGTTSSEDLIPSISKSGFKAIQTDPGQGPYRVIITPCITESVNSIFVLDEHSRIRQINSRHLRDMIRRIASQAHKVDTFILQSQLALDSAIVFSSGLADSVWSFDRVHRTATLTLGVLGEGKELEICHLAQALTILETSDSAKFAWIARDKEEERKLGTPPMSKSSGMDAREELEDRLKKIRKTCNSHEKKLLSGVVDAANLHTTFADVRVPSETIEALKTLTTLSLVRPEAFTYGVLATDKIPGLLLYGPPGTGKTLLAKAVAKESGATVLEIDGSDVYDMYVGEGEKNVKAIFTLARKLTPCVVFIDEADAIFGSRGTSSNRTSHRELINQFLREWDGMNDLSAFIMVATNRPYDLDDAVLRRLPRRLLVDLPTEKDREAILRIHLKDEVLDPSVCLATLAAQTPFYSGSDLKNLSVAAALACVREENNAARAHAGSGFYEYPSKRTLASRHFDKATEEISASISEDMSSLSAIKKFDEKFGDRRGRKKKSNGYGFGTLTEAEQNNMDAVRVRSAT